MSDFHNSASWRKLSKDFKTLKCHDCGSTKDIQAGHILAASEYPMARLWKINLKKQCQPCNLKQGVHLRRDWLTIKLLFYYGVIMILKILPWAIIVLALVIDQSRGPWDTTIAYQIAGPIIEYFLMALDKTLDAVATWISSRSE